MKKLRDCENYSKLILAILVALAVILILSICSLAGQIYQVVTWELYDPSGAFMIISAALTVIFVILSIAFVVQAVKRNHKINR